MGKKFYWLVVMIIVIVFMTSSFIYADESAITVTLNQEEIHFDEAPPIISGNRTLVPFRRLAEAIGVQVGWIEEERQIIGVGDQTEMVMTLGSDQAIVNGSVYQMNIAPQIVEGRALIPLRDFSETFGVKVEYSNGHVAMFYEEPLESLDANLSGFYTLGTGDRSSWTEIFGAAYPEVVSNPKVDMFNQVHLGWYEITDESGISTSGSQYGFRRPSGYERVLEELEFRNVDRNMMVFAHESQGALEQQLADSNKRSQIIDEIVETIMHENYTGVNLDIEGLGLSRLADSPGDVKEDYVFFVAELRQRLEDEYQLILTVPPANSVYGGYDYYRLGELADEVIVMAYDYHDRTLPSATAPIPLVEDGLQQLVEMVPAEKVVLGLRLPAVRYAEMTDGWRITHPYLHSVYDMIEERELLMKWDEIAKVNYVAFQDEEGHENIIFMESERSLIEKWRLVHRYELKGAALWRFGTIPDFVYEQLSSLIEG